jgi:hypothetical protein
MLTVTLLSGVTPLKLTKKRLKSSATNYGVYDKLHFSLKRGTLWEKVEQWKITNEPL